MNFSARLFLILCIPTMLMANPQRNRQMLGDLDFIANLFEIGYAPLEWKQELFGWDLEQEKLKAKSLISDDKPLTIKEFQRIVKDFCISVKDYHVTPHFYSTEWATLPFHVQSAEGKYFVTYRESESIPFSIGDEILLIDGIPIHEVVEELRIREVGSNNPETDQASAEFHLTARFGSSGHEIPQGTVEITYLPRFSDESQSVKIDWNYHANEVGEIKYANSKSLMPIPLSTVQHEPRDLFHKKFMTPHHKLFDRVRMLGEESAIMLGSRNSPLPPLGTVLWESDDNSEFHAYLFMIDDWEVCGYVRIPSYSVDGDAAAEDFAEIIEVFEELADAIVIDQLNNSGGLVLYLYALVAMLTDYEMDVPKHRLKLTQEDVYLALNRKKWTEHIKNDRASRKYFGNTFQGIWVDYPLVCCFFDYYQFLIDQWNEGKLFSDFGYLYGIEKIRPHPEVHYTKPILVLTNSLNFSAADYFPAIMQDNKRAKIMGTRTAGAGGYVTDISFPNLGGIEEISITGSFSVRPDGTPIENLGVTPDIPYKVTRQDLQNNYSDYKQNILQELRILLSEK